ncbi:calcium-binding protein P-like [Hibiscus syriacus]|uniref:calcium-binding protein P-like n=1 Tax=Hibiscus syriacus TaxID=106335 RepID=UPI001921F81E|nr:calcium-binding protein P-like [Hibiscus syriacus]
MGRPDADPEAQTEYELHPQEYDPNLETTTNAADEYQAQTYQNHNEQGQQYQMGAPGGTDPQAQPPQYPPPAQQQPPQYPPQQPNQAYPPPQRPAPYPPQNMQYNPNPAYTNMPNQQPAAAYPPQPVQSSSDAISDWLRP